MKLALMGLKFRHAGQACITANRVYVQRGVYDQFANILVKQVKEIRVGHGLDESTTMGPLTVPAGLDKMALQVEDAKMQGASVLIGGSKKDSKGGYYYEPTIIKDARPGMLVASEETFAPLLALYRFDTEEEAVEAANNTSVCYSLFVAAVTFYMLMSLTSHTDGSVLLFLHQGYRSYMAVTRESGGWHDWHEHWQLIDNRSSFWWNEGLRVW